MEEHRKTARAVTHLAGRAALGPGAGETLPCLVRNLSPVGACIAFCADVTVPESFDLFLESGGPAYRAHRIWHSGYEVGVVFEQARENAPEVLADDHLTGP